ncbi:MAG: hypothetical protein JNM17_23880 [Archangium sp.]|nr:hypothetical protein [Archangium sp.]
MRHSLGGATLVFAVLTACAPSPSDFDPLDDVAVLRQAGLPRMPVAQGGVTNARLGSSIAACRSNGLFTAQAFATGAPGIGTALLYTSGPSAFTPPDAGNEFGIGVLCTGSGNQPELIAWSSAPNAWRQTFSGSTDVLFVGARVDAMARGDSAMSPYLIAVDAGLYSNTGSNQPTLINTDLRRNVRVACAHGSNLCAVAHRASGATIYNAELGQELDAIPPPDAGRSVTAIAIGELSPAPGLEVAIAGDGVVDVYSRGMRTSLLYTLRPPQAVAGFGQALAIDRIDAGAGLASLWVGSPGEARVYRFLGDAGVVGVEVNAPVGTELGGALAIETDGKLLVGAPLWDGPFVDEGAVFRDTPEEWAPLGFIQGVQQECDVSAPFCRVTGMPGTCFVGRCIGGVVCADLVGSTNCSIGTDAGPNDPDGGSDAGNTGNDAGMVDAGSVIDGGNGVVDAGTGVVDGGTLDAGLVRDAGSDAGGDVVPVDAGPDVDGGGRENDAGMTDPPAVPEFTIMPCGCGQSALSPLALLALAFLRGRRTFNHTR